MKLLVIEDEAKVASLIAKGLRECGFTVDVAYDGVEGEKVALSGRYDLIILDIMLPARDGFTVLKNLREKRVEAKILLLTALGEVQDKIRGLNTGGDDYLTKPFDFEELKARVNALLRRSAQDKGDQLTVRDLVLDRKMQRVTRAGQEIELTTKEFQLLEYLLEHRNEVLTRAMIAQHVWNYGFETGTNVIEVYINYLRRKLDDGTDERLIQTVRGRGYMLVDEP